VIGKAFGENFARLAIETAKLEQVQQRSRAGRAELPRLRTGRPADRGVRKMLLAFSRDLRVVLLRLASRLQTLRWCTAQRLPLAPSVLREAHEVFAPLANRLGIWQIKWELEDLSSASRSPTPTARSPACWTKSAASARPRWSSAAPRSRPRCAPRASRPR
jgi:GTP pyrophosphokinase